MPSNYPHRILRGAVPVWYSGRVRFPKAHLLRECEGLEKTPDEAIETEVLKSVWSFEDFQGRPCRMCALQSVLYTVLRPGKESVFVTFTSQANPLAQDGNVHRYQWRASSPSGHKRLQQVARRFRIEVSSSSSGPFAYGFLPSRGAALLAENLRTIIRPEVTSLPEKAVMDCVWALLDDNPPEISPAEGPDPWELASLIVG